jgi:cell division protease FtsH
MRVFRRVSEARTPNESTFTPLRVNREGLKTDQLEADTGFDDRAPNLGFRNVAALDSVIDDLGDVVSYVADPARYAALKARPPTGILLYGEPGCGKTLLAKALAGEAGVPFYFVSATSFIERFVGLGASRIRELFQNASQDAPSIVFIDELDAVGRRRTDSADREFDHTLNQLLVELDGFLGAPGVITVGATNRIELLDPALVRPGRFDRKIEIGRPNREGREAVLRLYAAERPVAAGVDWGKVAEATEGCSPAELAALMNEAALLAARSDRRTIDWSDIRSALDRLVGGISSTTIAADEMRRRAVHEAGHCFAALQLSSTDPCMRSSVLSCGGSSTGTAWAWSRRRQVSSGPQLMAELIVLIAGRVAEETLLGSASTLAEADMALAAELAQRLENAELYTPHGPTTAAELMTWARLQAARMIEIGLDAVASIAGVLQESGSVFTDELRVLLNSTSMGTVAPAFPRI